jgi:hypothetical protein
LPICRKRPSFCNCALPPATAVCTRSSETSPIYFASGCISTLSRSRMPVRSVLVVDENPLVRRMLRMRPSGMSGVRSRFAVACRCGGSDPAIFSSRHSKTLSQVTADVKESTLKSSQPHVCQCFRLFSGKISGRERHKFVKNRDRRVVGGKTFSACEIRGERCSVFVTKMRENTWTRLLTPYN